MKRIFILGIVVWGVLFSYSGQSQSDIVISEGIRLGTTTPCSNTQAKNLSQEKREFFKQLKTVPNFTSSVPVQEVNINALPLGIDPLLTPITFSPFPALSPQFTIEGVGEETSSVNPADVNGDISPNYFFQVVNPSYYQIFNRHTGQAITDIIPSSSFWQDFNFTGAGDPLILYDQAAERWLFIEFSAFNQNTLALAISQTEDPTGEWAVYEFPTISFPDYPKIGLWQDSYFISTNETTQSKIPVYFLEREALLNGEPTFGIQSLLKIPKYPLFGLKTVTPINWEGNLLPNTATGPMVIRMYDDSWSNDGVDRLEIWEYKIDWDTPSNSDIFQSLEIPTSSFTSTLCHHPTNAFKCIEQPSGGLVSAIQYIIMNRPSYRKFDTHESIVCAFSVDVNGNNQAGIRWYELRRTGDENWSIYQEGTIAPDNNHRFMPTIAIDKYGNIAVAYAITGPNKQLSLRYTGRRVNDPLGQMTFEEHELATGLSNNNTWRWGDYFSMEVDPLEQTQFWFTGAYMKTNNQWGTKITAFSIHRDSVDLHPINLASPQSDTALNIPTPMTASFRNSGLLALDSFWLGYELEDGTVVIDTITYSLSGDSIYTHEFSQLASFPTLGNHSIKLFSGAANDNMPLNDTLVQNINHYPKYDVAIGHNSNLLSIGCDSIFILNLEIENSTLPVLSSAVIDITINDSPLPPIPWSGNLQHQEKDNFQIPLPSLVDSSNIIQVNIHSPNGFEDEMIENNSRSFTATLNNLVLCTFTLETDNFPNEISWDLKTQNGTVLYQGGDYASGNAINHQEQWCLDPNSCYIFTIYDSFGDGLSSGGYNIVNAAGTTLASIINTNFGSEETNQFCASFECNLSGSGSSSPVSAAGENDGSIMITTTAGIAPFKYSIDNGTNFQPSPMFNNLSGGIYDVVIQDAADCETKFQVEVLTCTMQTMIDVINESTSNANDGSITITASMGEPPYKYSIDGGDTSSDNNEFTGLSDGIYEAVVKDANDCTYTEHVEVSTTVSTINHNYGFNVTIAPNPTDGLIDISVNGIHDVSMLELLIFDNTGSRVHRGRLAKYNDYLRGKVSLRHLPDGVYFIQFQHPSLKKNMTKIIKQ